MHAHLHRFAYTPTEAQGLLLVGDLIAWTIERPWVRGVNRGGEPFKSCVPDGEYELVPFSRASGEQVLALRNEALGVYVRQWDGPGRYAILIHAGNYVEDVVGCIAPGRERAIHDNRVMVTSSRATLRELAKIMPFDEHHTLTIHNAAGAADKRVE